MGAAMGIVAAPCVGPFVVTLLTYVATLALMAGGLLLTSLMLGRRRVRGVVTFRSRRDV